MTNEKENMSSDKAIDYIENNFDTYLTQLKDLVKIPSVSFAGFDHSTIDKSADCVATLLNDCGLENVQKLTMPGVFPYVYGEHLHKPGKPTILLYAHHDVQPPGREEIWDTTPFEPVEKEGPGGMRLYGRGSADDKAGVCVHVASIAAFIKTVGELPVNVKVLIEGEEEIGSPNLFTFLEKHKELLQADVMVLTDCANYDSGVPSLTTSLRGMVGIDIEVKALNNTIHSGLWSGPVPDSGMALSKMLADLVDENGKITVPGILEEIPELSSEELDAINAIPFDEKKFIEQSGMVSSSVLKHQSHPLIQLWRYPSLTVCAVQASSKAQAGNVLNDTAWAKVSVRLAPGMNAEKVKNALMQHLKDSVPWGLEINMEEECSVEGWMTNPFEEKQAKIFQIAKETLEKGYDKECVYIGCGATIPFVKPFAKALNGAPALLVGIEDPYTNAHGENESLLISDLKKAILSQIYLFEEISKL